MPVAAPEKFLSSDALLATLVEALVPNG
jgi:hypothetical protein